MYYKIILRKSAACILALAMVLTTLGSVGVLSLPVYADETASSDSGETTNTTTTTLYVDASYTDDVVDGTTKFQTISDAVTYAVDTINPQSESERVTINVAPGDYEEQVVMENAQYITLQQDPDTVTEGGSVVNLHWYYCTGYCAGDCGLDGNYDPKINWSLDETWTGYNDGDEEFTKYELGQSLSDVSTISYYDTDGVAHKDVAVQKDHLGDFNVQAALVIQSSCSNITVKDFNIVNSIPVMVTEGEKRVGVVPQEDRNADNATSYVLPHRDNLVICDEDTEPERSDAINAAFAESSDVAIVNALEALTDLTAAQSAYLVRSNKYNERGHAISINGDKIILENVRARGNQDSVYISTGRIYFKNCDLIGGTDYIYGNATAVFDNCLLGAEGMTDKSYPATITAANTDSSNPYGYLFWNCTVYNVLDNITGGNVFGRPWRQDAQITFYKTQLDDTASVGASAASISSAGWSDMSDNTKEAARFYEYGTYNASGTAVDLSGRVVRDDGFGSVLDEWQILEFNPRNYFNNDYRSDEWDPMGFGDEYLSVVDEEIENATVTVPEGTVTTAALPTPSADSVEFHWVSDSANAVVSDDDTTLTLIRPAYGEEDISATLTLYARNTDEYQYGDKEDVSVTIAATTDTENVFNIPVTITQSTSDDNTYTVTITKDGATIKTQEIDVSALETTATIANIPASADGITYDVTIVSESDDFTVTTPEDGTTTITGITGKDVDLSITAKKFVDETISLSSISAAASDNSQTYDLITLAIAAGADESSIKSSDSIVVEYDIVMGTTHNNDGYVDLLSATPSSSCTTSALSTRYTLTKINQSWDQLDAVDCSQWFSGASNGDGQCLNLTGKFYYTGSETAHVTDTIDYKNGTVSVYGSNLSSTYTFASFPEDYSRGSVYMGFYPGSTSDDYTLSNVTVTYKKLVSDDDDTDATATPEPTATATATPAPTDGPVDSKWEIIDGTTTSGVEGSSVSSEISDGETIDTLTIASGDTTDFCYDLSFDGMPTSWSDADGDLIVSFDLYVDSTNGMSSDNWFIELATDNNAVASWHGYTSGNNLFGRFAGYANRKAAFIFGKNATNAGTPYVVGNEYGMTTDTWEPVTMKVNLSTMNILAASYGDASYTAVGSTLSGFTDGQLYLNFGGSNATGTIMIKNISASYVSANDSEKYTVSSGTISGGDVTLSSSSARAGETITITANPTTDGDIFTAIAVTGADSTEIELTKTSDTVYSFVMPAQAVTVTATMETAYTITTPTYTEYTTLGGTISAPSYALAGESVTITTTPYAGFEVSKYVITDESGNTVSISVDANGTFTMPSQNIKVDVEFEPETNKSVVYFKDMAYGSDTQSVYRIALDNAVTLMNYVKNSTLVKFSDINFTGLESIQVVTTGSGAALTIDLYDSTGVTDNVAVASATPVASGYKRYSNDVLYVNSGATALVSDTGGASSLMTVNGVTFYGITLDTSDVDLMGSNDLYVNISSTDTTSYIGNYWYIILTYTKPSFGTQETDSGRYYKDDDETLYGVIRFLQALEEATAVDSYGFVFCDSSGKILDASTKYIANTTSETIEGFYGDIYDISSDKFNDTSGATAYAKAFVEINGEYYYSSFYSGSVTSDSKIVSDPTASTESE